MKHCKILLILLFFCCANTFAQEPIVNWGKFLQPDYDIETTISSVLGIRNSELFIKRKSGLVSNQKVVIDKYSKDFSKLFSKEIRTSYGIVGDNKSLEKIFLTNNSIVAFYRGWQKASKQVSCYAQIYSMDCELQTEFIELHTFTVTQQLNSGNFNISISPDKSKIIVQTDMPYTKGEKEKVRIAVYNAQNMEIMWSKDITLTNESERGVRNEIYVDNDGNAYMFKTQFLPKNTRLYTLFTCNASNKVWQSNSVDLENKLMAQYKMGFNSNGDFVLVGFYGSQNENKIEGTYYSKMNKTSLRFDVQRNTPLGANLLRNWKSEKAAMLEGASISDFKLVDILSQSNGNSIIISESRYTTSKNIAPAGSEPKYEYSLYNNDIMVICLNQDGTQEWGAVINKNQTEKSKTTDPVKTSFIYGLCNDNLYVLWNNDALNVLSVSPTKWNDPSGQAFVGRKNFDSNTTLIPPFMNIVDKNGNVLYREGTYGLPLFNLYKDSPFSLYMNPRLFVNDSDGLIIFSEMRNTQRYRIGKMQLH
ncbi:MAG: hypothetical protein MJ197_01740 [Bacteroidales bacterium]|nr:hypothetical protein [Bacteroidales bacterium]